jgi:GT2 family glycosyltransferase
MIDVSVLVVSHNSAAFLARCLESVARRTGGLSIETCVIDNASSDDSVDIATGRPGVRVVANGANRGFAAGVNQGIASTSGRYVLWLNPDAVFVSDGLRALVAYLDAHPSVGIIGPRILDPDGGRQRSARAFPSYDWAVAHRHSLLTRLFPNNPYSRRYLLGDLDLSVPQAVDWVSGAALLHRRELVERIGGLDEAFFMYCEDVDFCLRARQAGWTTAYHPAFEVQHEVAGSTRSQPRAMLVERHRSLWRYYSKHFHRHPLVDSVAWAAIWSRCGLVVAQETARRWRRHGT